MHSLLIGSSDSSGHWTTVASTPFFSISCVGKKTKFLSYCYDLHLKVDKMLPHCKVQVNVVSLKKLELPPPDSGYDGTAIQWKENFESSFSEICEIGR